VFAMDATWLTAPRRDRRVILESAGTIVCIDGLFDVALKGSGWGLMEACHVLGQLLDGGAQCIATGTPLGYRSTIERADTLAGRFEMVQVLPPTEEEAAKILAGVKLRYDAFHGVTIGDDAIQAAIVGSRRFLMHRQLPDRALDILDDAAARVKLR